MKNTSMLVSALLWFNRKGTYRKVRHVFKDTKGISSSVPFNQLIYNNEYGDLPVFYEGDVV